MHDEASSALLVRQFSIEMPVIPVGSLGRPSLRQQIRDALSSISAIRLRGEPIITWDMWPSFHPTRKYIHVRVPIDAILDDWFDYAADILLWIYLYIDRYGRLRGFVDYRDAWVAKGILRGPIKSRILAGSTPISIW